MPSKTITNRGKRRLAQQREADRARNAERAAAAGEVLARFGKRPPIKNRSRRRKAHNSLLFWLTDSGYFPHSTGRAPFCHEQLQMVERLEQVYNNGGKTAHAGFRGSAKSAIHELAALWALATGRRRFLAWYGATAPIAKAASHAILIELSQNDALLADWPDLCWLFHALEGEYQRTRNQKYDGKLTYLSTNSSRIIIPFLNGRGKFDRWACIVTKGLNAEDAARAQRWKTPTGENIRPDAIVVDDPQSDKSAASSPAITGRLKLITESLSHSGSRDETMALAVSGNIIEPGDVMDQLLDADKFPDFVGDTIPQLRSFPAAKDTLWVQYRDIRSNFDKTVPGDRQRAIDAANQLYADHQQEMNAGGDATWQHAFRPGEENALHAAMNEWSDLGEDAFQASCQQSPAARDADDDSTIRVPATAVRRQTKLSRGVCPMDTQAVTIGIDVQQDVLAWLAVAWQPGFSGTIVDYGAFPEQQVRRIDWANIRHPLREQHPGAGVEGAIFQGIRDLTCQLADREWLTTAGQPIHASKILIDSGFQTTTVYRAVEQSGLPAVLLPVKGFSITAIKKPMAEWRVSPGGRKGTNWIIQRPSSQSIRIVEADVNAWKTHLYRRFETPEGDSGALTIFGDGGTDHGMLGEHLGTEKGVSVTAYGRSVFEWQTPPHAHQHWWDCLVYAAVGASVEGITLAHEPAVAIPKKRRTVDLGELQRQARRKR